MATRTDEFGTGLERWNLQAWLDYVMVKILMSRVSDVVPKTYVPILRLVAEDVGKVDEAYLVRAIQDPGAEDVKGYPSVMPATPVSEAELREIVDFVKSLSE